MSSGIIEENGGVMKKWYQSKTIWFNLLTGLVAVAGVFGFAAFQPDQTTMEIIGVIVTAVNIALRFVTKEPVG